MNNPLHYLKHHEKSSAIFAAILISALYGLANNRYLYGALTNIGYDHSVYMIVARGWKEGAIPYRDLFDHKGPLLYLPYLLACQINPNSAAPLGAIMLAFTAASLYYVWRLAESATQSISAAFWITLATQIFILPCYSGNPSEIIIPLQLASLYYFLFGSASQRGTRYHLAAGILTGIVFWIKFNLCGFWAGLIACDLLNTFKQQGFNKTISATFQILAGWLIITLPVLGYFFQHNALNDLFDAYFATNLAYAQIKTTTDPIKALGMMAPGNGLEIGKMLFPSLLGVAGSMLIALGMFLILKTKFQCFKKAGYVICTAFTVISIFSGGRFGYNHYYYSLIPFQIMGVILVYESFTSIFNSRSAFILIKFLIISALAIVSARRIIKFRCDYDGQTKRQESEIRKLIHGASSNSKKSFMICSPEVSFKYYLLADHPNPIKYFAPIGSPKDENAYYENLAAALKNKEIAFIMEGTHEFGEEPSPRDAIIREIHDYRTKHFFELSEWIQTNEDGSSKVRLFQRLATSGTPLRR
jgi:hypothetical protein